MRFSVLWVLFGILEFHGSRSRFDGFGVVLKPGRKEMLAVHC